MDTGAQALVRPHPTEPLPCPYKLRGKLMLLYLSSHGLRAASGVVRPSLCSLIDLPQES